MHFNRNYSNANAQETRQGLPVKENYLSLIVKAKQENQKEDELRQMMDQVHDQRLLFFNCLLTWIQVDYENSYVCI